MSRSDLPELQPFTKLMILLRLTSTLNNGNGDLTCQEFRQAVNNVPHPERVQSTANDRELLALDSVTAVLVRNRKDFITACFMSARRFNVAILEDNNDDLYLNTDRPIVGEQLMEPVIGAMGNGLKGGTIVGLRVLKGNDLWAALQAKADDDMGGGLGDEDVAWHCAKYKSISLQDHAETLCAYLKAYRDATAEKRSIYSTIFHNYLIIACWRKMRQRLTCWSTLAFMFKWVDGWGLYESEIKHFDFTNNKALRVRGPGDRTLARYIGANPDILTTVVEGIFATGGRQFIEEHKGFKAIFDAIKSPKGPAEADGPLYTKETAPAFHRLVFTTFAALGTVFSVLNNGIKCSKQMISTLDTIRVLSHLLLCILCSSAFKQHIKVITMDGHYIATLSPNHHDKQLKIEHGRQYGIMLALKRSDDSPNVNISPRVDGVDPDSQEGDGSNRDAEGDNDLEDTYETDPDVTDFEKIDLSSRVDALVKWVKTFVAHFLGKRVLEDYIQRLGREADVNATTFSVNRLNHRGPSLSDFEAVIDTTLTNTKGKASTVAEVVKAIKGRMNSEKLKQLDGKASRIMAEFQELFDNPGKPLTRQYSVPMHCEAVLLLLLDYIRKSEEARLAGEQVKNGKIAVSKLSCPVCWRLFNIQKQDKQNELTIQGCRGVVYPVVLPHWLDDKVYKLLLHEFQGYLRLQLDRLVDDNADTERNDTQHSPLSETHSNKSYLSINEGVPRKEMHVVSAYDVISQMVESHVQDYSDSTR